MGFSFSTIEPNQFGQVTKWDVPLADWTGIKFQNAHDDTLGNAISRRTEDFIWDDNNPASPEVLNRAFGIEGQLKFDKPMSAQRAQLIHDRKRREIESEAYLNSASHSWHSVKAGIGFGASLIGGLSHPVDLGLSFLPFIGSEKAATEVAGLGGAAWRQALARGVVSEEAAIASKIPGGRLTVATVDGILNQAIMEIPVAWQKHRDQANYTVVDSAFNILAGGAFAGAVKGLGLALEKAARLWREADPKMREALMTDTLKSTMTDEPPQAHWAFGMDEAAIREKVDERIRAENPLNTVAELAQRRKDEFSATGDWIGPGGFKYRDTTGITVTDKKVKEVWDDILHKRQPSTGYSLKDVIGDSELLQKFPHLNDVRVYIDLVSNKAGGGFMKISSERGVIKINLPVDLKIEGGKVESVRYKTVKVDNSRQAGEGKYTTVDRPASDVVTQVLQHEIEHSIQTHLGLPEGGSTMDFYLDKNRPFSEESAGEAYAYYKSLAGEAMARVSEIRGKMTSAERAAEAPWVTLEKMLTDEGILKPGQSIDDVLTVKVGGNVVPQEHVNSVREQSVNNYLTAAKAEHEARIKGLVDAETQKVIDEVKRMNPAQPKETVDRYTFKNVPDEKNVADIEQDTAEIHKTVLNTVANEEQRAKLDAEIKAGLKELEEQPSVDKAIDALLPCATERARK
jgi:hypothetical protein